MNTQQRKNLRKVILDKLDDDMMPLTVGVGVGGHTITNQYVYAGCSQWSGCGRDWDVAKNAYAYIIDGEYQLTFPDLSYFDGHNQIERQSRYYLQPDRSEEPPNEAIGEPLQRVPDRILIDLADGLVQAIEAHAAVQAAQNEKAAELVQKLSTE